MADININANPGKALPELHGQSVLSIAGKVSLRAYMDATGAERMPGFQLRYIRFLRPGVAERLTVPALPFSEIERRGARMYKGVARPTGTAPADQAGEGGSTPTATLQRREGGARKRRPLGPRKIRRGSPTAG